ncbi:MAG: DUF2798 domain-containing protein [Alphaproteobacteria bacterium]
MALIAGSLVVAAGILRTRGPVPNFFAIWLETVEVAYPIIVVCILLIAPWVQRRIDRLLPPD